MPNPALTEKIRNLPPLLDSLERDAEVSDLLRRSDAARERFRQMFPLDGVEQSALEDYRKEWMARYVYNSNAIEGSTLTLEDTELVLEGEFVPTDSPARYIFAARGVYVFAYSSHLGEGTLHQVAKRLRSGELVWESLESALSRWNVISQIPVDRVTFMTTGREGEFRTAYGVIEFTHCKLSWSRILPNLIARDDGLTPLASKQWAYRDLKAVGRNLDLVDMDELEDDDDWS